MPATSPSADPPRPSSANATSASTPTSVTAEQPHLRSLLFRRTSVYLSDIPSPESAPPTPSPSAYSSPNNTFFSNKDKDEYRRHEGPKENLNRQRGVLTWILQRHILCLRFIWFIALLLGEHGAFYIMLYRCSWPQNVTWTDDGSGPQDWYRIAIIADPQLTDWYSYNQSGWVLTLVEFYTDLFMRRSFHRLHNHLSPDAVLFLGDLMDGGRETEDPKEFFKNMDRFYNKVFYSKDTAWNQSPIVMDIEENDEQEQRNMGPRKAEELEEPITGHHQQLVDVPMDRSSRAAIRESGKSVRLFVAGNHDVGFGDTLIRKSMVRYKKEFGSVNYEIKVGNHSLIVLDTLALSANKTTIREEAQEFLSSIGNEDPTAPRILFTHVPLFRLDTTYCGEQREAKQLILDRNGEQYQNMVNASLSSEILRKIQPDMVFSGDDHDWCEIAHSLDNRLTPEVTLPTFSFAQGIRQPGFVVLSLYNPRGLVRNDSPMDFVYESPHPALVQSTSWPEAGATAASDRLTFAYEECMLPNQLSIYFAYAAVLIPTLVLVLVRRLWRDKRGGHRSGAVLVRWRDGWEGSAGGLHVLDTGNVLSTGSTTAVKVVSSGTSWNQPRPADNTNDQGTLASEVEMGSQYCCDTDSPRIFPPLRPLLPTSPAVVATEQSQESLWYEWVRRLLDRRFWKLVGRDIWDVARFAVPVYALLVFISWN